jgi:hypothetical protein
MNDHNRCYAFIFDLLVMNCHFWDNDDLIIHYILFFWYIVRFNLYMFYLRFLYLGSERRWTNTVLSYVCFDLIVSGIFRLLELMAKLSLLSILWVSLYNRDLIISLKICFYKTICTCFPFRTTSWNYFSFFYLYVFPCVLYSLVSQI